MNDYNFTPYLSKVTTEWLSPTETKIFDKVSQGEFNSFSEEIHSFLKRVMHRWRFLAEQSALSEPKLTSYNGYNQQVDHVEMPPETLQLLQEVYHYRPFSKEKPLWFRYLCNYLLAKNGEAGVCCSFCCTDGMVQLLRKYPTEKTKTILEELEEGKAKTFAHGAQFVTEIQGGSDAGQNIVWAENVAEDCYKIFGEKWFCSNIIADYFLVTARPKGAISGAKGVAAFLVPAHLQGKRNGYEIRRLKNKLGTRNLPTAEVSFNGAIAYAVGPLERGLSNMIRVVITCSRIHAALTSAAFLQRVAHDVSHYCQFRTVFGKPVKNYPMAFQELQEIQEAADRLTAGTFELVARKWLRPLPEDPKLQQKEKIVLRILIMLNKMAVTKEAANKIHQAISLYAGNGIEYEFSPIPRIFNDAVVNEVWEGPHHLLISNAFYDFKEALKQFSLEELMEQTGLKNNNEITQELKEVLTNPIEDDGLLEFQNVALKLMKTFQKQALH